VAGSASRPLRNSERRDQIRNSKFSIPNFKLGQSHHRRLTASRNPVPFGRVGSTSHREFRSLVTIPYLVNSTRIANADALHFTAGYNARANSPGLISSNSNCAKSAIQSASLCLAPLSTISTRLTGSCVQLPFALREHERTRMIDFSPLLWEFTGSEQALHRQYTRSRCLCTACEVPVYCLYTSEPPTLLPAIINYG
jgi:hypothetical protein